MQTRRDSVLRRLLRVVEMVEMEGMGENEGHWGGNEGHGGQRRAARYGMPVERALVQACGESM